MSVKRINEFYAFEDKVSELYEFLVQIQNFIKKSKGNFECSILQDTEVPEKFLVLEEWDSKESHKLSLENCPKGMMIAASDLFEKPPTGYFYSIDA